MGCGPQKKTQAPLTWTNTEIGALKVDVIDAYLPQQPKLNAPTVKVRVTNQHYTSQKFAGVSGQNSINEHYDYIINSYYQSEGRAIEVGLFQNDKLVAFGLVDADPIIKKGKEVQELRCILSQQKNPKFGYVTLRAHFEQLPYTKATFKFDTATIRKKNGGLYAIRSTIGEQIRQTQFKKDLEESPPIWKDQTFSFMVPQGVNTAKIELIDQKENVIGEADVDLHQVLQSNKGDQVIAIDQLFYNDHKEGSKPLDAGTLKYAYVVGNEASFSQVKDVLKSGFKGVRSRREIEEAIVERVLPSQE